MRMVRQAAPVIRNENVAGIKEGVWQSNDCNVCRQMPNSTAKLLCLNLGHCGIPPLVEMYD